MLAGRGAICKIGENGGRSGGKKILESMIKCLFLNIAVGITVALADLSAADNLLVDPSFEATVNRWQLFLPKDSSEATIKFSFSTKAAHDGKYGAVLISDQPARAGLFPQPETITVRAGEKLRLRAWIKPGPKFAVESGTPGVVLRATLFDRWGRDYPEGHVFIGRKGIAKGDPDALAGPAVPEGWSKIEGTVEIPKGCEKIGFFVFLWKASGTLYVDDLEIERL